jgi:hypothetical protein
MNLFKECINKLNMSLVDPSELMAVKLQNSTIGKLKVGIAFKLK